MFELPDLPFSYNALEPYIDAKTMEIHHDKHHAGYVKKLNAALEALEIDKDINKLLKNIDSIPEEKRQAIINNGGGHANHSLFWQILKKDVEISGKIKEAIDRDFGSFEDFKKKFSDAAVSRFGSGWAWLVVNKGKLEITSTANQDNPISEGKTPILCLDVWEHAYYLKYQNKRPDYSEAFFNVINWPEVEKNFEALL